MNYEINNSNSNNKNVYVIEHPLVQHKLTLLRKKDTSFPSFRALLNEISMLMAFEITKDMPTELISIDTPLESIGSPVINENKMVFVSILRAGNGILDGLLSVVPSASVGHIGLYRDPKSLEAIEYYFKMPTQMQDKDVIVVDPMLATGHTAVAAINRLKILEPKSIKFLCLISCPEGLKTLQDSHPDLKIFTASIDRELNDHGYILPGLGDAGDRIFGTS